MLGRGVPSGWQAASSKTSSRSRNRFFMP
jgi:hypothetical protein